MTEPAADKPAVSAFDGKAFCRNLSNQAGVYTMLDEKGVALYIGKASQLKKRVSSYFDARPKNSRLSRMIAQIQYIDLAITQTEAEALILENQRIKAHQPRYNVLLKDDKSYPFVYVSSRDEYPRVAFHRGGKSRPGRYFGPFPSAGSVRESIHLIQRIFRLRNCEDSVFSHRSRPCLQYQIKRCSAPCVKHISVAEYQTDVSDALEFLQGKNEMVIDRLSERMHQAAKKQAYEDATRYRDQIANLRSIQAKQYVDTADDTDIIALIVESGITAIELMSIRGGRNIGSRTYYPSGASGERAGKVMAAFLGQFYNNKQAPAVLVLSDKADDQPLFSETLSQSAGRRITIISRPRTTRAKLLAMATASGQNAVALRRLSKASIERQFLELEQLLGLEQMPERIECFDISHTSGTRTVASCVVFDKSGALKGQYRRFNLTGITPADDYAAMAQVLKRRYTRVVKEEAMLPDLIVVDGGKGQLSRAIEVMRELNLTEIPLLGIAKGVSRRSGHEDWYRSWNTTAIQPPPDAVAGHLIQNIRDEAHRFAIAGHRARRKKTMKKSQLEEIAGIGAGKRRELLRFFGGIQGVRDASLEQLQRVNGINAKLAELVYAALRE
ncbi:MAG: excinuclease ABC subunit UvrC [Xanthomonadales bacterium]|nr:excinuclease ABC subunit UvrC [Xanthomonadales bacterium]